MSALWAWLQTQRWAIWLAIVAVAIAGVLALVIGMRRASESAGRALEKLEQEKRARDAQRKMDSIPHPDRADVDERLRDGDF